MPTERDHLEPYEHVVCVDHIEDLASFLEGHLNEAFKGITDYNVRASMLAATLLTVAQKADGFDTRKPMVPVALPMPSVTGGIKSIVDKWKWRKKR